MEAFLVLLGLYLFVVLIVLPIWTIVKIIRQRSDQEILQQQLSALQQEIQTLRSELKHQPASPTTSAIVALRRPRPNRRLSLPRRG